ncbi:MAG: hypothetical protein ACRD12_16855 [Acidimicrobiales bacterium]
MSRKAVVAGIVAVAAVMGAASLAWACTTFSRLDLGASTARAGAEVAVRGEDAAVNAPVVLRWDSRTAPVIGRATTDAAGTFTATVKVPETAPLGVHVLLATDANGELARGAVEVVGAAGERTPAQAAFRTDAQPAAATDWLKVGTGILAVAALAMVPLLGLALLSRKPALARR